MNRQSILTITSIVVLLVATSGVVAATPGEGPPGDMPDVVPDFVSDLLGAISEFLGSLLQAVFSLVDGLVPDESGGGTVFE